MERDEEGTTSTNTKSQIVVPMTKHEKMLERRKKLPVYATRDEFLAAVKDNQVMVMILVGETGSEKNNANSMKLDIVNWARLVVRNPVELRPCP